MRIVTRPDFDGIVCAVLIYEAEEIDAPVLWVEPGAVQSREAEICRGDIMANLPYDSRCSLWFDHHVSNRLEETVPGAFRIAPSAARVVYDYYTQRNRLKEDYETLVHETDIIDAAMLSRDQVLHPENYPYILLSMTIKNHDESDPPYWNRLISLLRESNIKKILDDHEVNRRTIEVIKENEVFADILKRHTTIHGPISVTDFRNLEDVPSGNRFLTYSLFPETFASVRIRYAGKEKDVVIVSIGHSIFNRQCNVNVGKLLARYGGGGHKGAGGCSIDPGQADTVIAELLDILKQNQSQ